MPDPKIKKTRKPVKKVVTNRKTGKVTVSKTPVRRMTMVKKTKGAMSPATKTVKKISPAMKLKIAETKKANLIKTNRQLKKQHKQKVNAAKLRTMTKQTKKY